MLRFVMRQYFATVRLIISDILSDCPFASSAARLRRISPHFLHLCMIIKPFLASGCAPIGSSSPRHSLARSPGFTSTCNDHRQNGQWLREVYPRGSTRLPQCTHTNSLSFFINLFCSTVLPPYFYFCESSPRNASKATPSREGVSNCDEYSMTFHVRSAALLAACLSDLPSR